MIYTGDFRLENVWYEIRSERKIPFYSIVFQTQPRLPCTCAVGIIHNNLCLLPSCTFISAGLSCTFLLLFSVFFFTLNIIRIHPCCDNIQWTYLHTLNTHTYTQSYLHNQDVLYVMWREERERMCQNLENARHFKQHPKKNPDIIRKNDIDLSYIQWLI